MKRLAILLVIGALLVVAPMANGQEEEGESILRVGLDQPWTTLNVTAGFEVAVYDYWNLMYATLTDKSAEDFSTIPGLAESWEGSDDGLTYTYHLREGLVWSDGEPLTADDIAWTINTSRDQSWSNHISTVQNLDAVAVDDRTVTITSSVPDPRLPTMDVYVVPRHIWEPIAPDGEAVVSYEALDGVGSGPFIFEAYVPEQSLSVTANPDYWGGRPQIDGVVWQIYTNPDAMVAALQQGELDAAHNISEASVPALEADPNIEVVLGYQGGFDEIAINGGQAEGQPHPALLDIEVRKAIAHAIDKEAFIEDALSGFGDAATTISVSPDESWMPEIPADEQLNYDVERANQILDDAGYLDTDGDGIREMPGGGDNIVLRHGVNTDSTTYQAVGDFFPGWMESIGLGVDLIPADGGQLFDIIVTGEYDTFAWGWTPYVDPSPMLSYFTSNELGNFNDANWSDPEFDELYAQQNQELDPAVRRDLVHQMLRILYDDVVYLPIYYAPDLQAYRTDRFEGWIKQPAEIGPVLFTNSSPVYFSLSPIGGGADAGTNWLPIAIGAAVVLIGAGVLVSASRRRGKSADERE